MIPTTATITSSKHQTADARAIPQPAVLERPSVRGKFLFASGEKLLVRGVTYGAFRPDDRKREYYRSVESRKSAVACRAGGA